MKKELREIAAEASSNLGWWQPWQFEEQVGPKEAAFIAAMSPQIAIELLDENESMRLELDALIEAAQRLLSNKRGEDDWLILAVHCQDLADAIAKATGATK